MDITAGQVVLVTGASGFIGGRLVRRLVERRCRVACLVRAGSRIDGLRECGAAVLTGDVTDRGSVERALAGTKATAVFQLAGLVRAVNLEEFTRVNAVGVENVAAACAACAAPPVLVVVSSLAAAGPVAVGGLRVEADAAAPVSGYGRSKLSGERAAVGYAGVLPITIVRPPMVFGPGDGGVLEIFRPIARWGVHFVPGSGARDRRVSLVHVDDLVEGLLLAAERGERARPDSAPGTGIYFITGEEHPTYAELGTHVAGALGRGPPAVVRVPGPLLRLIGLGGDAAARWRRVPGWVNSDKVSEVLAEGSWACSSAKARGELGWGPGAGLAERLRETAEWYRAKGRL